MQTYFSFYFHLGSNYIYKVIIKLLYCDQRFSCECVLEFTWKETYIFLFEETKSIKVKVKDGLNPKRQLLLCLKDNREIPLTGTDNPAPLSQIEGEAVDLAKYLNIYIETE